MVKALEAVSNRRAVMIVIVELIARIRNTKQNIYIHKTALNPSNSNIKNKEKDI